MAVTRKATAQGGVLSAPPPAFDARSLLRSRLLHSQLAKASQLAAGVAAEIVAPVEAVEEVRVSDVAEPLLADESGTEEGGGVADVDQDLVEEVLVAKHRRRRGVPSVAAHCSPLRPNHGTDRSMSRTVFYVYLSGVYVRHNAGRDNEFRNEPTKIADS